MEPLHGGGVTDGAFQGGTTGRATSGPIARGIGERRAGALAEQVREPQRVEAGRDDDPVEGDALAFVLVVDLDDDFGLDRFEADDAAGDRAHRLGPVEHVLDLEGEHATVGALEELAAVPHPSERTAHVYLPARVQRGAASLNNDQMRRPGGWALTMTRCRCACCATTTASGCCARLPSTRPAGTASTAPTSCAGSTASSR